MKHVKIYQNGQKIYGETCDSLHPNSTERLLILEHNEITDGNHQRKIRTYWNTIHLGESAVAVIKEVE